MQIAKKKLVGGWKVLRDCPACSGEEIGLDDDRLSICSGRSSKSNRSIKSCRSAKSSSEPGRTKDVTSVPQYDAEGYCCFHPSIRVAKKKTMGGWKILHEICPDCHEEGLTKRSSRRGPRRSLSRSSRRSRSRHRSASKARDECDDTLSIASSLSKGSVRSMGKSSKSSHSGGPCKVKNMKLRDAQNVPGRYYGYIDEQHRPHGRGILRYENGMEWKGVWESGEQVNGRLEGCKSNF